MATEPECPGCDYASGRICDDCLELIERKLDASDAVAGGFGCLLILILLACAAAVVFGWK